MTDLCTEFTNLPEDKKKNVAEAAIVAFIARNLSNNTMDLFTLKTFLDDAEKTGYIQSQNLKDYKKKIDALADVQSNLDLLQRELSSYTMYVQNNELDKVSTKIILSRLDQVKQAIDRAKNVLSQDVMSNIENQYNQLRTLGIEIINMITTLNSLKSVFKMVEDANSFIAQKMGEMQGASLSKQADVFLLLASKANTTNRSLSLMIDSLKSQKEKSTYFKDMLNAYINILQSAKETFSAIARFSETMFTLLKALDDFMDAVNNYGNEEKKYYLANPSYQGRVMDDIRRILTSLGKLKSLADEISRNSYIDQKTASSLINSINDVRANIYNYMYDVKKNLISNDYRWYDYRIFQQAEQLAQAEGGIPLPDVTPQSTERFPGEYYLREFYSKIRDMMEWSSMKLRSADIGSKVLGGMGSFVGGIVTAVYSLTPTGIIDNWNQLMAMIRGTQDAVNKYGWGEGLRKAGWQLLVDMFGTPERVLSFIGQAVAWYAMGRLFSTLKLGKIPVGDLVLNLLQADPFGTSLVLLDIANVKGRLRAVLKKSYEEGKPVARIVGSEVLENAIKNSIGEDLVKSANLKVSKNAMNTVLAGLRNIAENPEAINEQIKNIVKGVKEVGISEAREAASLFQRSYTSLKDLVKPEYFKSAIKELGASQLSGIPKKLLEAFGKVSEVPATKVLNVVDDLRTKLATLSRTIGDLDLVRNSLSKIMPKELADSISKRFEAIKAELRSGKIGEVKLALDEISRQLHDVTNKAINGLTVIRDKIGSLSKIIGDEEVAKINNIVKEGLDEASKNPFNITKHIDRIVGSLDNIKKSFEAKAMGLLTKLQEYGVFLTDEQKNMIVRLKNIPKEVAEQVEMLKNPAAWQTLDELNATLGKLSEIGDAILLSERTLVDISSSFEKVKTNIAEAVQLFDQKLARSIADANPSNFFSTLRDAVATMTKNLDKSRVPIVMNLANIMKSIAEDPNVSPILRSNMHELLTYTKTSLSGFIDMYLQDYVRKITTETGAMTMRTVEDIRNRLDIVRDVAGDTTIDKLKQTLNRRFEGLGDLRKTLYEVHGELSKVRSDLLSTAESLGQKLKSLVPDISDADIRSSINYGTATKELVKKVFDSGRPEAFEILDKFNEVVSKLRRLDNVAIDIFNVAKNIDNYVNEIKNLAEKVVQSPDIKAKIASATPDNIDSVLKSVVDENLKNPKALGDLASLYVALRQLEKSEKLPDMLRSGLVNIINYIEEKLNIKRNINELTYTEASLSGFIDRYLQDYVSKIVTETGAMKLRTVDDVGSRLDVVRDIVGNDVMNRAKQWLSKGFEGLGDLRKTLYDIHGELSKVRNDLLNSARDLGQKLKSLVPSISDADIERAIKYGVASKEMVVKIFNSGVAEAFEILDKFNEVVSKLKRLENVAVDIFNLAKGIDDYIGEIKNVAGKLVTSPEIKSRIANITPDNVDAVLKSVFDENVKNPKMFGDLVSLYVALRQLLESEKLPEMLRSGLAKVVNYVEDKLGEATGAKVCDVANKLSQWVLQEERLLRSLPSDVIDEIRYLKNLADAGKLTLNDLLRVTELLGRIAPILTSEMELNMFRSILREIQDYVNVLKESGVTRNVLDIVGKVGSKIQEINISLTQRKPGEVGGPTRKLVTIDIKEYRPIMPEFVNGLLQIKDTITKYFKDVATKYNVEEDVNTILKELEKGELTSASVEAANRLMNAILEMSGVAKPLSLRNMLNSVKDFARKVWDKVEELYRKGTMSESEYYGWKAFKELADVIQKDLESGYMLPEGWGYLDLSVEYVKSRPIVIPESLRPKILEELSKTEKIGKITYDGIEIKARRLITQVGNTLRIDYELEFPGGRKAVYTHVVRTVGKDAKGNIIGAIESKFSYDPPIEEAVAIYRSGDTSNPLYRVGEAVTRINQNIEDFIRKFDDSYDVIKNIGVVTEGGKISTLGSALPKFTSYALTALYATANLTNLFKKPGLPQLPQLQLWLSTLATDKSNIISALQPYLKEVDPEINDLLKQYGLSGAGIYKGDKINLVLAIPTGNERIEEFKKWAITVLPEQNTKILTPVLSLKETSILVLPTLNIPAELATQKLKEVTGTTGTTTITPEILQSPETVAQQAQKQGIDVREITITIPTTQTAQLPTTALPAPATPPETPQTETTPATVTVTPPQGTGLPSAYGYSGAKTGYQYELLVI